MAVACDAGTVFPHAHARHLWKEAMLLQLLERIPFHQCLVFFNSRTRYGAPWMLTEQHRGPP